MYETNSSRESSTSSIIVATAIIHTYIHTYIPPPKHWFYSYRYCLLPSSTQVAFIVRICIRLRPLVISLFPLQIFLCTTAAAARCWSQPTFTPRPPCRTMRTTSLPCHQTVPSPYTSPARIYPQCSVIVQHCLIGPPEQGQCASICSMSALTSCPLHISSTLLVPIHLYIANLLLTT